MIVWQAHKGKIESLAFSADGRFLATATGGTRTVHLWDATSGTLIRKLSADWPDARRLGAVKAVAFAPQAPLVIAATDRSATVWDTNTWEAVSDLHAVYAYELSIGPGGTPALAASNYDGVELWDDCGRPMETERLALSRRFSPQGGVNSLDFSPDGKLLAVCNTRQAALWNPAGPTKVRALARPPGNHRGAVRFSPDGSRVAVAHGKMVDVWDVAAKGDPLLTLVAGSGRQPAVWCVGWSDGGRVLLTAGADGFARFWDAATGAEVRSFAWDIGKVYCAAFSPDGLTCAAGGTNGQVVVWDVDA